MRQSKGGRRRAAASRGVAVVVAGRRRWAPSWRCECGAAVFAFWGEGGGGGVKRRIGAVLHTQQSRHGDHHLLLAELRIQRDEKKTKKCYLRQSEMVFIYQMCVHCVTFAARVRVCACVRVRVRECFCFWVEGPPQPPTLSQDDLAHTHALKLSLSQGAAFFSRRLLLRHRRGGAAAAAARRLFGRRRRRRRRLLLHLRLLRQRQRARVFQVQAPRGRRDRRRE